MKRSPIFRFFLWAPGLALLALLAFPAWGDVVKTRDGKVLRGTVRLEKGKIIVKPARGAEVPVDLENVAEYTQQVEAAAEPRAVDDPAPNGPVSPELQPSTRPVRGFRVEYFADPEMKYLQLTRVEPMVTYSGGSREGPHAQVNRGCSVRWTALLEVPETQLYEFVLDTTAGIRLFIDGKPIINRPDIHTRTRGVSGQVQLEAGRKHELRLEYYGRGQSGSQNLKLHYTGGAKRRTPTPLPLAWVTPPPRSAPPTVAIISPRQSELVAAQDTLILEVDAKDRDGTVAQLRYYIDDRLHYTQEAGPWKLEWPDPSPGAHKLTVEAVDNDGITSGPVSVAFIVTGNGGGTLEKTPWADAPVGSGRWIGSTRLDKEKGIFTLKSRGGDLYGRNDLMHFVFQPLVGDATVIANMRSVEPESPTTAAGIFLRATLGSKTQDPEVFFGMSTTNMIRMYRDANTGGKRAGAEQFVPPRWLKLSRHGSTISFFQSENGKEWHLLNQRHVELPETVWVGLASVGSAEKPSEAVFSNVSIIPGAPAMQAPVAGVMLRGGTILSGQPISVDETNVKITRDNKELVLPLNQVAMVIFRPLPAEMAAMLDNRIGALLVSGDFKDGAVSLEDGQVAVESLLFGQSRHRADTDVIAAVVGVRDVKKRKYEVTALDGSIYKSDNVAVVGDRLKITDLAGLTFELTGQQIGQMRIHRKSDTESDKETRRD